MPGRRRYYSRAQRAQAYRGRQFPLSRYGRVYVERGTEANLARYGPSAFQVRATAAGGGPGAAMAQQQLANRQKDGYYGRGGYIGRTLGRFVGDKVGLGSAGAMAGDKAGDWLWGKTKGYLGMGQYTAPGTSNSLISGSNRTAPRFGSVSDETGALIISHREYIGDVFGPESTARNFKNRTFDLNPGLEQTFPWLSQIAQNYEEYEFGQLVFEFKSTVNASVAGDGQMGTVVLVTNYNSASREFDDKNTMMQYDGSQSCRSTQHARHGVECDPSKISGAAGHYVRVGPKPKQDIGNYDHGTFQLATVGMPSEFDNAPIGELWVYYTVKLRKPRLFSGRGLNISRDVHVFNMSPSTSDVEGVGLKIAKHASNSLGCDVTLTSAHDLDTTTTQNDAGMMEIRFPDHFSGNVEITLTMAGQMHADWSSSTASSSHVGLIRRLGFDYDGGSTQYNQPRTTGNVDVISDIYGSWPGASGTLAESSPAVTVPTSDLLKPQWTTSCFSANGDENRNDTFIVKCHLKVGVATAGQKNSILCAVPRVSATSGSLLQGSFDIREYNTFGADPAEGKAQGSFVNTITEVVVDPNSMDTF